MPTDFTAAFRAAAGVAESDPRSSPLAHPSTHFSAAIRALARDLVVTRALLSVLRTAYLTPAFSSATQSALSFSLSPTVSGAELAATLSTLAPHTAAALARALSYPAPPPAPAPDAASAAPNSASAPALTPAAALPLHLSAALTSSCSAARALAPLLGSPTFAAADCDAADAAVASALASSLSAVSALTAMLSSAAEAQSIARALRRQRRRAAAERAADAAAGLAGSGLGRFVAALTASAGQTAERERQVQELIGDSDQSDFEDTTAPAPANADSGAGFRADARKRAGKFFKYRRDSSASGAAAAITAPVAASIADSAAPDTGPGDAHGPPAVSGAEQTHRRAALGSLQALAGVIAHELDTMRRERRDVIVPARAPARGAKFGPRKAVAQTSKANAAALGDTGAAGSKAAEDEDGVATVDLSALLAGSGGGDGSMDPFIASKGGGAHSPRAVAPHGTTVSGIGWERVPGEDPAVSGAHTGIMHRRRSLSPPNDAVGRAQARQWARAAGEDRSSGVGGLHAGGLGGDDEDDDGSGYGAYHERVSQQVYAARAHESEDVDLQQAHEAERTMTTINEMLTVFNVKLAEQGEVITSIYGNTMESTSNINAGSEQLEKALNRGSTWTTVLVAIFLTMTLIVLLLDWANN